MSTTKSFNERSNMPNKKNKPVKPSLTAQDVCVCMHTALRKICSSKITSAAYNLIHLIKNIQPPELDPWVMFGELVAKELRSNKTEPYKAIETAVSCLEDTWFDAQQKATPAFMCGDARTWMYTLLCTLRCFETIDIACMGTYLIDR